MNYLTFRKNALQAQSMVKNKINHLTSTDIEKHIMEEYDRHYPKKNNEV